MMLLRRAGLLAALMLICGYALGCAPSSSVPLDTLLAAPQEVEIAGQKYLLETFLNRDFMPSSPPDGKPLTALLWVVAVDPSQPSPPLDADRLWLINGQEFWEADLTDKTPAYQPDLGLALQKAVGDGPKWEVGIKVEAVIRLVDASGSTYLLRASGQEIKASH